MIAFDIDTRNRTCPLSQLLTKQGLNSVALLIGLLTSLVNPAGAETHFSTELRPLLISHCGDCHSGDAAEGGIAFDHYSDSANVQKDFELWEKVIRLIKERQMPPADAAELEAETLQKMISGIEYELSQFDCSEIDRPGQVTIRRLNKAEYNNTVRDLTGLDLRLADDFPSDDVGNGFDNIADVLSLPPILLEKYLQAAENISTRFGKTRKLVVGYFPLNRKMKLLKRKSPLPPKTLSYLPAKHFVDPSDRKSWPDYFRLCEVLGSRMLAS